MNGEEHRKVMPRHLAREACLYVRQAADCVENTESLQRQYNLKQQALAFGWSVERVMVIDSDVGQSGVSRRRLGFGRLLQRIRRGRVGIVMALEPSRLTRNFSDWQRLLESCALNNTLVLYGGGDCSIFAIRTTELSSVATR